MSREHPIRKLAEIIAKTYLREERYSAVDRLATAIDPTGVKLALYEILRGLDRKEVPEDLFKEFNRFLEMLDDEAKRDYALRELKNIALLALAYKVG